jgi:hypothetical protein
MNKFVLFSLVLGYSLFGPICSLWFQLLDCILDMHKYSVKSSGMSIVNFILVLRLEYFPLNFFLSPKASVLCFIYNMGKNTVACKK